MQMPTTAPASPDFKRHLAPAGAALALAGVVLAVCIPGMDAVAASHAMHQTVEAAKLSYPMISSHVISGEIMTAYGTTLCTVGQHFSQELSRLCIPQASEIHFTFGSALETAGTTLNRGREICSSLMATGLQACRQWVDATASTPGPLADALQQTIESSAKGGSFFSKITDLRQMSLADAVDHLWLGLKWIGGALIAIKGFDEAARWSASYVRKADAWIGCSRKVGEIMTKRFPGFVSRMADFREKMRSRISAQEITSRPSDTGKTVQPESDLARMVVANSIGKYLDSAYANDPVVRTAVDHIGSLEDLKQEIGEAFDKKTRMVFQTEYRYAKIDSSKPSDPTGLSIGP